MIWAPLSLCFQVASVFSVSQGQDDNKTLRDLKFQTGDYMEVAIA